MTRVVHVCDCGIGNVQSVVNALHIAEVDACVVRDPRELKSAVKVLLPGVGAFGASMDALRASGFDAELREHVQTRGGFLLGICLGMQLLTEVGMEFGRCEGLGFIPGSVEAVDISSLPALRLPHVGWNDLTIQSDCALLEGLGRDKCFYFAHSFAMQPTDSDSIIATTDYGGPVVAMVQKGNVFGTQFHPEKSQAVGIRLLSSFASL